MASRVYVLHFQRRFYGANNRHPQGAQHYVGIVLDGDVQRRLTEHLTGHGSPLVAAVVAAGIEVQLVADVLGDRGLERRWHNRHGSQLCPIRRDAPVVGVGDRDPTRRRRVGRAGPRPQDSDALPDEP
jgi:hypothetical protein